MSSELHLHPRRLRSHAVAAAALSEELRALLRGSHELTTLAHTEVGAGTAADQEQLHVGVRHCAHELAELAETLGGVAAAAEATDLQVARSLSHPGELQ